jgi:hypothetical protein
MVVMAVMVRETAHGARPIVQKREEIQSAVAQRLGV